MATLVELFDLALRHHQNGALRQAEPLYRQILQADSRHADALHLLGFLLHQTGASDAGLTLIRQAISLNPTAAVFHSNLGIVLMEQGLLQEAVASYRRALQLKPRFADALSNLGIALKDLGRPTEAVECCRQALSINPDRAQTHNILGNALRDLGRVAEAVDCYRQALRLDPQSFDALCNLGLALKDLGQVAEAIDCGRQAIAINPSHAPAHNNLAIALTSQGQFAAATKSFQEAIHLKPGYASAHWNLSLLKLMHGDFAAAWPDFEYRWRLASFVERHIHRPLWDGSPLNGKAILLYPEQGLGDVIQFIRYAPLVKARGGTVLFECPPRLRRLLSDVAGIDQLVTEGEELPPFDVRAPLLSLPGLFDTALETIPADIPYLRAEAKLTCKWREELAPLEGFKVGISWQGSPTHEADRARSVSLSHFEALARLEDVRLMSLQKGPGTEELGKLAGQFPVLDFHDRLDTEAAFIDTAAVMMNLDLVVTVDTAVAHLAGALGVAVWVLLPFVPDWRWLLKQPDSPWYPTMRLFRQRQVGDWTEVFENVARALNTLR